jgi:hypothetical protein
MRNPMAAGLAVTGAIAACLAAACLAADETAYAPTYDELVHGFVSPPDSARPWVYWFVSDGNQSREGITADFEAMKRVGIGGMIFMEVNQGAAKGPIDFLSPQWLEMFKHANEEAARLGLKITMNSSPGWTGSGGPWIKPEQSMQKLVSSETEIAGPHRDVAVLAFPTPVETYRIPDVEEKALYRRGYLSSQSGISAVLASPAAYPALAPEQVIPKASIIVLTGEMDSEGQLVWDVPQGHWTVLRFGATSTSANTSPAPAAGLGLECDKMSRAALDAHYRDFLGKLIEDVGALTGESLTAFHIDSWEVGVQNWTAEFPDEFRARRGYDLVRYLPVMTGRVVDSREVSERFLWDLRQTALDLITENYSGYLAELAHKHGMGLSIEPYDGIPCTDMVYGANADMPMGEFWTDGPFTAYSCVEAASIGHTYGKRVIGAEAFTSGGWEQWQAHPATLKTLGDWAFCIGINRFVIHRWSAQPWLDRVPGMTMGPWGIHYERTQTWFEQSRAWNEYLARCQFLLQQGLFVADVCFLESEDSPQVFRAPPSAMRGDLPDRLGYNFDGMTPEALIAQATAKDGRIVLSDGMSYRVLVLPERRTMTPALLAKLTELVKAGATIMGPHPLLAPTLVGYPACDEEVRRLADDLWGDCDGEKVTEHAYGKGRVVWPSALSEDDSNPFEYAKWIWLAEGDPRASAPVGTRFFRRVFDLGEGSQVQSARLHVTADNAFEVWLNGRSVGGGDNWREVYTLNVAPMLRPGSNVLAVTATNGADTPNPAGLIAALVIRFRDGGMLEVATDRQWQAAPRVEGDWTSAATDGEGWGAAMELGPFGVSPWGEIGAAALYGDFGEVTSYLRGVSVPPDFESAGPLRYIHRRVDGTEVYFVANRDDHWAGVECGFRVTDRTPELWDPMTGRITKPAVYRQRDGRTILPLWLEPAGSVFVLFRDGERPSVAPVVAVGRDGESVLPEPDQSLTDPPAVELVRDQNGGIGVLAWQTGRYELKSASGESASVEVDAVPEPVAIAGPWDVSFEADRGAPDRITLDALTDWSKHPDLRVRYFSGTAVYSKTISVPSSMLGEGMRLYLDLGRVAVMAQAKLNGKDLGILWKAPFTVDITDAVSGGDNALEIAVTNLWPNRMIGDKTLPPEQRLTWAAWDPFSADSPLLESGLLGPVTLRSAREVFVKL